MTEVKNHMDDDHQEGVEGGQQPEKKVTLTTEGQAEEARQKRDVALNEFRKSRLWGSFDQDWQLLRGECLRADTRYNQRTADMKDYLSKLRAAKIAGTGMKGVEKPSTAIFDSKLVSGWENLNYRIIGALKIWNRSEFRNVRELIELTETLREEAMKKLDAQATQLEAGLKDQSAEIKAKGKDEVAAAAIRAKLMKHGLPTGTPANHNGESLAA